MIQPLVSILSPAYNHEKYITACIESVIAQTYPHWEMLILDDESSDRTLEIAQRYAEQDERIKVFTQDHKGIFRLADTYNAGLAHSGGAYVAILECDDTWLPDKLRVQVGVLESNPQVVLSSTQALLQSDDTEKDRISPQTDRNSIQLFQNIPIGSFIALSLQQRWVLALTCVIRRDTLLRIGGFQHVDGMPVTDFPTFLALSLQGPFHFTEQALAQWRIYPGQSSKVFHADLHVKAYEVVDAHLDQVNALDAQTKSQIRGHFKRQSLAGLVRSGNYGLMRGEFRQARKDFRNAFTHSAKGMLKWKMQALKGLCAAILHIRREPGHI